MIALLIIDMQVSLFEGDPPRHDAEGVIRRINDVARAVRDAGGIVVFIQHDGDQDDGLAPGSDGWQILPDLERLEQDFVVRKQACDAFYESALPGILAQHGVTQVLVTGCATDFCVDTTIRVAASRDFEVTVVADGHTTRDREHLDAASIIHHHNWMWRKLILPRSEVQVLPASEIVSGLRAQHSL